MSGVGIVAVNFTWKDYRFGRFGLGKLFLADTSQDLYTIECPESLKLDGLGEKPVESNLEAIPQQQEQVPQNNDEWDERKGLFYTIVQMIFAFLFLTQGASLIKSIVIATLLLVIGLSQLGYIHWSNWFVNVARFVQPNRGEEQEPVWKTLFLLSINFIMSLFPGLNEIE